MHFGLVPSRGWHEWPDRTTPYFIHRTNYAPLLLAGIWDVWESPYPEDFEGGHVITSISVVSTPPGRYMAKFDERSQLILEGKYAVNWLQLGMRQRTSVLLSLIMKASIWKPIAPPLLPFWPAIRRRKWYAR